MPKSKITAKKTDEKMLTKEEDQVCKAKHAEQAEHSGGFQIFHRLFRHKIFFVFDIFWCLMRAKIIVNKNNFQFDRISLFTF
jgi:hypothetical protein